MPKRIQRKRSKGWRMPPNTIYVGRPTKWGNPFALGESVGFTDITSREQAVELYREHITGQGVWEVLDITELLGKDLACWCSLDQPCHADVLLELANPNNAS